MALSRRVLPSNCPNLNTEQIQDGAQKVVIVLRQLLFDRMTELDQYGCGTDGWYASSLIWCTHAMYQAVVMGCCWTDAAQSLQSAVKDLHQIHRRLDGGSMLYCNERYKDVMHHECRIALWLVSNSGGCDNNNDRSVVTDLLIGRLARLATVTFYTIHLQNFALDWQPLDRLLWADATTVGTFRKQCRLLCCDALGRPAVTRAFSNSTFDHAISGWGMLLYRDQTTTNTDGRKHLEAQKQRVLRLICNDLQRYDMFDAARVEQITASRTTTLHTVAAGNGNDNGNTTTSSSTSLPEKNKDDINDRRRRQQQQHMITIPENVQHVVNGMYLLHVFDNLIQSLTTATSSWYERYVYSSTTANDFVNNLNELLLSSSSSSSSSSIQWRVKHRRLTEEPVILFSRGDWCLYWHRQCVPYCSGHDVLFKWMYIVRHECDDCVFSGFVDIGDVIDMFLIRDGDEEQDGSDTDDDDDDDDDEIVFRC